MSYELRGVGGYYRYLAHVWPTVLDLAEVSNGNPFQSLRSAS